MENNGFNRILTFKEKMLYLKGDVNITHITTLRFMAKRRTLMRETHANFGWKFRVAIEVCQYEVFSNVYECLLFSLDAK